MRADNSGHVFAGISGNCLAGAKELLAFSDVITGVAVMNEKGTHIFGDDTLLFDLDGIQLHASFRSFFQVNTEMAIAMLRYCKDLLGEEKRGVLLDLYCGVGSIGLYLSSLFQKVYGIEIVKDAVSLAKKNAAANGIEAEYIVGKTESRLKDLLLQVPSADTVILDPPPPGTANGRGQKPSPTTAQKRFSIFPATRRVSADDLKELTKKYRVVSAKPFDLFPRTAHVETVVLMTRCGLNDEFRQANRNMLWFWSGKSDKN